MNSVQYLNLRSLHKVMYMTGIHVEEQIPNTSTSHRRTQSLSAKVSTICWIKDWLYQVSLCSLYFYSVFCCYCYYPARPYITFLIFWKIKNFAKSETQGILKLLTTLKITVKVDLVYFLSDIIFINPEKTEIIYYDICMHRSDSVIRSWNTYG